MGSLFLREGNAITNQSTEKSIIYIERDRKFNRMINAAKLEWIAPLQNHQSKKITKNIRIFNFENPIIIYNYIRSANFTYTYIFPRLDAYVCAHLNQWLYVYSSSHVCLCLCVCCVVFADCWCDRAVHDGELKAHLFACLFNRLAFVLCSASSSVRVK